MKDIAVQNTNLETITAHVEGGGFFPSPNLWFSNIMYACM